MKLSRSIFKNARFFDVTLRDSLQCLDKIYTLSEKKVLLHNILRKNNIDSIEIGSFVSPKILPQLENTDHLFNYANSLSHNKKLFVLTPNNYAVKKALNIGINNFSLITSVSDNFQKKNINKTLNETKQNLDKMLKLINDKNIKLYISCVNECPFSGKINNEFILNEITEYYYKYNFINNICLSDTCGSLEFNNFKDIIDGMIKRGFDLTRFSLHLHQNMNSPETTYNIILYALKNKITLFDVSILNSGGCSVTIKNNNDLHANLNYSFFDM
jgi:hydroxymethylglutaryl-CoA lyase